MSDKVLPSLVVMQKTYACNDANCGPTEEITDRDLFTRQTGKLLLTLGQMFLVMPAFNNHIRPATGKRLISIGRKLSGK